MPKKRVRVLFRRVEFVGGNKPSAHLGELLSKVISVAPSPRDRIQRMEIYGDVVFSQSHANGSSLFGELLRYETGAAIQVLSMGEQFIPKTIGTPAGTEPLKGSFYFLLTGNSIVFIENELTPRRVEDYFTWIIRDKYSLIDKETQVHLTRKIELEDTLSLEEINRITLKPEPIAAVDAQRLAKADSLESVRTISIAAPATAFDYLRAAHMETTDLGALAEEGASIEVTVQFRFKKKRSAVVLNHADVEKMIRHIPDDEIELHGPSGREKGGKLVHIIVPSEVETIDGLIDPQSASDVLAAGYRHFVERGYIVG